MTAPDPLLGTQLGPCLLESLVGRGGMGRVYKARHLALDRLVAVKLIDEGGAAGTGTREAVLVEARAAARLDDPRVVAIHEVGEDRGIPFIVMQWIDGESLEGRVRRLGPLLAPEALAILRETAAALKAAHAAGIVHRDVKPANILVDSKGAVKLTDFGIARVAGAAENPAEEVAGSFHFMAPEQALGGAPDPRSDLYALGATWFYALTAQPPYPGPALEALTRHRDEPAPDVRSRRPEVTEKAAALLRRLMAKNPDERPADAGEVLRELSAVGMLLDTDSSGSPFKILPAPPRQEPATAPEVLATPAAAAPAATVTLPRAPLPAPPVLAPAAGMGSRRSFIGLLTAFCLVAIGWQWRRVGPEDWAGGALFLACVPAALSLDRRWTGLRRAAGVVAAVAALGCWLRAGLALGVPSLEAAICAGLAACALLSAVYLGLWGGEASERAWACALAPAAGLGLLLSALTWSLPAGQSWAATAAANVAQWRDVFIASGGGWRWLGTTGALAALWSALRLRRPPSG